tara:strand:+ start:218 stop:745 length:528 start_codon:yes stop_codon:yes gene_type:complete
MNAEFKDISKEAFIIAYKENFGNITIACESAGVGRGQYKSWCDKDPEFRQRLAEIEPEEIMLDFGEHKLMERIAKGDTLATMFLLKTKGKRRGYIERQEVAHEGDVVKQITVNVLKANHVEELPSSTPQLDGDENVIEDTGFVVPATEAANIQDIPLYEFDKEVELPNEMDIYEE